MAWSDRSAVLDQRLPHRFNDEVEILIGVPADVRSEERAKGNELETELAQVVERSARKAAGEAGALVTGLDLGVEEGDPPLVALVERDARTPSLTRR